MLLALFSPALAGVLINEVLYDPSGTDGGNEWIELCNSGSDTVDLTGYSFETAGSSYGEAYTFASGTLAPGAYLLVGAGSSTHTATFSPNLQNGGTESDALRLLDASGTVVDTVLYDEPNSTGLAEDDGTTPSSGAPAATSGKGIGRWPDCTDSNVSATDFLLYESAALTPGAANSAPATGGGDDTGTPTTGTVDCTGSEHVVINELMPDPDGTDSGNEWIELTNTGTSTVTLDGWMLEYGTSSYSSDWTFPDATTLAPGEYVIVGAGGLSASLTLGNAGSSSADGLRLTCDGGAVDTVVYGGNDNTDGFTDESGTVVTSVAPAVVEGESLQRIPDGYDSDTNGIDFVSGTASPGSENTTIPPQTADCTGSDGVKINEMAYTTDAEWIEIYNAGSSAVDLSSWVFEFGTSEYNKSATVPTVDALAPGGYLVLGSAGAAVKDVELDMDYGNASDTDAVRITCNGDPVDTLLYGDPNDPGWTDDSGAVATSLAPTHKDGESLARVEDGYDTDQCGVDFVEEEDPTPGAANHPNTCVPDGGSLLKINEFLYAAAGADTDTSWVEIVNMGPEPVSLTRFELEWATKEFASSKDYRFPAGATIDPGEYLVVGGNYVDEASYVADGMDFGNGTGADGLRLLDCEGTVLDSVLYGDELEDPLEGDGGSTEVVPGTSDGASLGRYPNGEDSDHAADWHPYLVPTPGAENTDPGAPPDDTGTGGGKGGCNQDGASAPPGGGGCGTKLPLGGMELALATVALLRRRK